MNKEHRYVCVSILQVSALQEVCASEAEGFLVNEAKKWATKAAKDYKIVNHGERVRFRFQSWKAKTLPDTLVSVL